MSAKAPTCDTRQARVVDGKGDTVDAVAYLGQGPHNIVAVDWGDLCPAPLYRTARFNTVFASERVGLLLRLLVDKSLASVGSLHLIGHSLGAHVAGMAAKQLRAALATRPHRLTGRVKEATPRYFTGIFLSIEWA